jgi:RNA polymerase sigma-70 factor (ECF subfamily)
MKDEKQIIERAKAGDTDAFEQLLIANQDNVYRLALKMTKNEQDALDISQEVFIKMYTSLSGFRGESRFSVWLYRLTYNQCMDFIRKKSGENIISLNKENERGEEYEIEIPDLRNIPEEKLLKKEKTKIIAESIKELPKKQYEVLVMREISDMSYSEIAETLDISEGTVKSRISRARLNLANTLVKKGTFPQNFRQIDTKADTESVSKEKAHEKAHEKAKENSGENSGEASDSQTEAITKESAEEPTKKEGGADNE